MAPTAEVMFHNFSFDSSSRRNHNIPSVSPFAPSPAQPAVSASDLNLLAQQFGQQSLSSDPRTSRAYNYPANYQSSQLRQEYFPSSSSSSSNSEAYPSDYQYSHQFVRSQRQASTRLQCNPAHAREISSLVDGMISSSGQSSTYQPTAQRAYTYPEPTTDYSPDEFEDEGIDMTSEENPSWELSYRRSTDFSATESRIQRPIRIRKKKIRPGCI
jgi:hypothetical protein